MNQLNTYNGSAEFNGRKPWAINQYGILVGRGIRSNYEPDDWATYDRNRYAYIWGHYKSNPDLGWRRAEWNRAGVPRMESFIRQCLADAASIQPAPPSGGACPPAGPVTAALQQACDAYARSAVDQSQQYSDRSCQGGQPEWWNTNYRYHYDWCLTRPRNPVPAEGTYLRQAVLDQCAAAASPASDSAGPTQRWCKAPNLAIPGNNRQQRRGLSVPECQAACESVSWCRSVDYRKTGMCYLQDVTAREVPLKPQPGDPFDHYTTDCASIGAR